MSGAPVVVTGMGVVSALGTGVERVWERLLAGQSGLGPLTLFASTRCGHLPVGEAPVDREGPGSCSRNDHLAALVVEEALGMAGIVDGSRCGIVLGATVGGILDSESFLSGLLKNEKVSPSLLDHHEVASSTEYCAARFGLFGPGATISTACSSGAMAIAMAGDLVESGEADVVVAVGVDSLCRLTLHGFDSLLLLDPKGCRPFDVGRQGLSLGEGAAALVIESEASAKRRGAAPLARLSGWGRSCDAHHMTAPAPGGEWAARAMRDAVRMAGLDGGDIDYVNAHGTGTRDNDVAEAQAMRDVLGESLPPVSSTKGSFGHTLAASGAVDAVVCIQAIRRGELPPNPGFSKMDPEIGIEPIRERRSANVRHVLNNSLGFGGNNAALVLSSPETSRKGEASVRIPLALSVAGLGVMGPAGTSVEDVFRQVGSAGVARTVHETAAPLPEGRMEVLESPEIPDSRRLPPAKRRRLSRFLEIGLSALRDAAEDARERGMVMEGEPISVVVGTALGDLHNTVDFLVNLFKQDGRSPMPASFIHSVHNGVAALGAIANGARGMNGTTVHREISFETALWQARRVIERGESNAALVGATDGLHPYLLAALKHWRKVADPAGVPGEGAVMAALSRPASGVRPHARVTAIAFGRTRGDTPEGAAVASWISSVLERDGLRVRDLDVVLTESQEVVEALRQSGASRLARGSYTRFCGDYCSSSAFGFAVAVGLVSGKIPPSAVGAEKEGPARCVLVLTLGRNGEKGMCCVMA